MASLANYNTLLMQRISTLDKLAMPRNLSDVVRNFLVDHNMTPKWKHIQVVVEHSVVSYFLLLDGSVYEGMEEFLISSLPTLDVILMTHVPEWDGTRGCGNIRDENEHMIAWA